MERLAFDQLIQLEFAACHRHCHKGIVIQPSLRSLATWHVYLMPHSGIYRAAIMAFAIYFNNYPHSAPQIDFQTGVLHPLISSAGSGAPTFDAQALVPEWSLQTRVYALLNAVYDAFVDVPAPLKCANPDAARLIRQDRDAFARRARDALPQCDATVVEQKELNTPRKWGAHRESIAAAIAARA
jgi:ubiquitin-protein ligase